MVKHKDFRLRLFGLLWLAGMAGVMTLMLVPLPLLPEGAPPAAVVRLLVLVQPTILLSVAVLIGVLLTHRLGLIDYGNADPSTSEGAYWINGALAISAQEQIYFLQELYRNELPFRVEHQRLVKDIMIAEAEQE